LDGRPGKVELGPGYAWYSPDPFQSPLADHPCISSNHLRQLSDENISFVNDSFCHVQTVKWVHH